MADCYDALRASRVYKPNYDHAGAVKTLLEGDDRMMPAHFDPRVLEAFSRLVPQFEALYDKIKDS